MGLPSSNNTTISPYSLVAGDYEFVIETVDQFDAVTYHFFRVEVKSTSRTTSVETFARALLKDSNNLDDYQNLYQELFNVSFVIGNFT